MAIPLAVSPATLTPGTYLKVNLIAGAASPSIGPLKILLLAPQSSAGDLIDDTEIRSGGGADTAGISFGVGTLGHLAAKQIYAGNATAEVDFGAPVAGTGAAISTITLGGVPTSNNAVEITLMGRSIAVGWLIGESNSDIRDKIILAINRLDDDLAVVASSGGAGVVTLTFKVPGLVGNDCIVKTRLTLPQSGSETTAPLVNTQFTGGVTDPDYSNILDSAQGTEYHYIVECLSNTDAELATSSSNAERAIDHIKLFNEGLEASLQQLIYASTATQAAAELAAIARNEGFVQHVLCVNAGSLPCEFAGAEAGDRLSFISIDPAANRIGNVIGSGLFGSDDTNTDKPTPAETESAIGNGVSIISYAANGDLLSVRPITTFSQTPSGGPDRRLLDTQNVDAAYIVARDLRSSLPAEFPNAKIQKDAPPGGEPPPVGVIEERDIKVFVISRLRVFQNNGVILKSALDTVIDDGTLIVQVNDFDPSQVDIVVPLQVIPPLAKFGIVVNREPVS